MPVHLPVAPAAEVDGARLAGLRQALIRWLIYYRADDPEDTAQEILARAWAKGLSDQPSEYWRVVARNEVITQRRRRRIRALSLDREQQGGVTLVDEVADDPLVLGDDRAQLLTAVPEPEREWLLRYYRHSNASPAERATAMRTRHRARRKLGLEPPEPKPRTGKRIVFPPDDPRLDVLTPEQREWLLAYMNDPGKREPRDAVRAFYLRRKVLAAVCILLLPFLTMIMFASVGFTPPPAVPNLVP
jgi:DNA-directed RNA polymerase specialized sigma24 family protein